MRPASTCGIPFARTHWPRALHTVTPQPSLTTTPGRGSHHGTLRALPRPMGAHHLVRTRPTSSCLFHAEALDAFQNPFQPAIDPGGNHAAPPSVLQSVRDQAHMP